MHKGIISVCLAAALNMSVMPAYSPSAGLKNTLSALPDEARAAVAERARTEEEERDIAALARMLWGEARGVKSATNQAACVWVVLNRVDDARWSGDIVEVLSQPYQFCGYKASFPVEDWAWELAADVYDRWVDEKETGQDAGRVIPDDYFFWCGSRNGEKNWFYKEFGDTDYWDFTWETPYDD